MAKRQIKQKIKSDFTGLVKSQV